MGQNVHKHNALIYLLEIITRRIHNLLISVIKQKQIISNVIRNFNQSTPYDAMQLALESFKSSVLQLTNVVQKQAFPSFSN